MAFEFALSSPSSSSDAVNPKQVVSVRFRALRVFKRGGWLSALALLLPACFDPLIEDPGAQGGNQGITPATPGITPSAGTPGSPAVTSTATSPVTPVTPPGTATPPATPVTPGVTPPGVTPPAGSTGPTGPTGPTGAEPVTSEPASNDTAAPGTSGSESSNPTNTGTGASGGIDIDTSTDGGVEAGASE